MTTPIDIYRGIDMASVLSAIKDRDSLQLTQRIISGNRMVLEAQIAQMKMLEEAIGNRIESMGR